jgi:hypothetical protein
MIHTGHDEYVFEELEAAARRMSIVTMTNRTISELKPLFDEMKEATDRENLCARRAVAKAPSWTALTETSFETAT